MEVEPVSSNPKGKEKKKKRKRDQEGEELPSDDKKKKKQRKGEASGASNDPTIDPPLEATGITVVASEVKEKKKRNKNKSSAEASDPPPSSAIEPTPGAGAVDKPKKSRKWKSTNDDVVDADGDGEPSPKSKPKSKKRKKEETIEDNEHPSAVLHTEGHPPQKRKKSKASVHPSPLDDSDLTEQSQKGSHSFPSSLQITNTKHSFNCCSSYLHLLPIHLSRNLEIQ